jgi:hypothetical protein
VDIMTFCKRIKLAFILAAAIFNVSFSQTWAQQHRGPSTAEERARAVQIAKLLRADPLADSNTKDREWLVKWLIEVPDISIKLCGGVLGDTGDSNKSQYPGALLATLMASQAAYVIEHPDKAKDSTAVYVAGIDGALDAYHAIRSKDSSFHAKQLDEFDQKRNEGKLADSVKSATKKCK